MAEVGILDLQVNDNSQQAAESLKSIAEALIRVKTAVSNAEKIGEAGKQIAELATKINAYLGKSVMQKIDALGNALKGLQNLGKVTINIRENGGAKRVKDTLDSVKETSGGIGEAISASLEKGEERVTHVNEEIERLKSELGEGVKSGLFDDAKIDSYTNRLNELSEEYKNVSETVQDAGIAREVQDTFREVGESVQETTGVVRQNIEELISQLNTSQIPTRGFSDFVDRMLGIKRTMLDAKEAADVFMTDAAKQASTLLDQLNQKISYKNFGKAIDEMMGIGKKTSNAFNPLNTKLSDIAENTERIEQIAKRAGEAFSNSLKNALDSAKKVYRETEEGIRATEHLKELQYEEVTRAVGDYYQMRPDIPRSEIHAAPTDLSGNTPMAFALRGDWGERQQTAAIHDEMRSTGQTFEEVTQRIREFVEELNNAAEPMNEFASNMEMIQMKAMGWNATNMFEGLFNMWNSYRMSNALESGSVAGYLPPSFIPGEGTVSDAIPDLRWPSEELEEAKNSMQSTGENSEELKNKLEDLDKEIKQKKHDVGGLIGAFNKFKDIISHLGISKLINQFTRMAKMRMMRYAIREIAKGFSEGIENVYGYSKAIDGTFVKSMDSAATTLLQMKNSIGAAVAPVLEALIPYMQIVVNWFITLINYANQFFALISGKSMWTRALPKATSAFEDQKKAAKGAAAAVKELLADWDELNIIQSETSGGGSSGGKAAVDYLNMFEQVAEFDSKIRKLFDFIQDNLDTFKALAIGIGAALLGWKLSTAFTELLPWLATAGTALAALGVITVSLALTDITGKEYMNTGNVGWLLLDALTGAVGAELAGELVQRIAGATVGNVAKGFVLILEGTIDIKNAVSGFTLKAEGRSWALAAMGAIKAGIGGGLIASALGATIAGSVIAGGIVTLAAIAISVPLILQAKKKASYRKMAEDAFDKTSKGGIKPERYLEELQKRLDEMTRDSELVINVGASLGEHKADLADALASLKGLNGIVTGKDKLSETDAEAFKAAWDTVLTELGEIQEVSTKTIYAGLDEAIANGSQKVKDAAVELRKSAIEIGSIMNGAVGAMEADVDMLEKKIIAGTASEPELERYKLIYTTLANDTESGLAELQEALKKGTHFDFSGDEGSVANAIGFINGMSSDLITPALEKAKAQFDAEIAAVNEKQQLLDQMHELGYVNDDQYLTITEFYKSLTATYTDRLDEAQKEILASTQTAFDAIANQALEGFLNIDQTDSNAVNAYINSVFVPIADAIIKAGGKIPEEVSRAISSQNTTENAKIVLESIMPQWDQFGDFKYMSVDDIVKNMSGVMIRGIMEANAELGDYLAENELNPFDYVEGEARENLAKYIEDTFDPYTARKVMEKILPDFVEAFNTELSGNLFGIEGNGDQDFGDVLERELGNQEVMMKIVITPIAGFDEEPVDVIEEMLKNSGNWFTPDDMSRMAEVLGLDMQDFLYYASQVELPEDTVEFLKQVVELYNEMNGTNHMFGNTPIPMPEVDHTSFDSSLDDVQEKVKETISVINQLHYALEGFGYHRGNQDTYTGPLGAAGLRLPNLQFRAAGGPVRSGDLVMADENGNFEMKGRMGNQPVVANNQQIVEGISKGVSNANGDVVSELRVLATMMQRMLNKEFVARAVPSSGWARNNEKSAQAYDRVTG